MTRNDMLELNKITECIIQKRDLYIKHATYFKILPLNKYVTTIYKHFPKDIKKFTKKETITFLKNKRKKH